MINIFLKLIRNIDQYAIDHSNKTQDGEIDIIKFQKENPYIMDITFYRYEFEKAGNQSKEYTIAKNSKTY